MTSLAIQIKQTSFEQVSKCSWSDNMMSWDGCMKSTPLSFHVSDMLFKRCLVRPEDSGEKRNVDGIINLVIQPSYVSNVTLSDANVTLLSFGDGFTSQAKGINKHFWEICLFIFFWTRGNSQLQTVTQSTHQHLSSSSIYVTSSIKNKVLKCQ